MLHVIQNSKEILVCSGAGCRAWGADEISRELESMESLASGTGYTVRQVSCFNKCGGGSSVKIGPNEEVIKFRAPEEALDFFGVRVPVPAFA